jgi:carboxyl-terminal processing protease
MPRFRKAAVASLILVPVLAGGFMLQARPTRDGAQLLDQVLTLVNSRFVDTLETSALFEKAARGLVAELKDPYSELFTPKQIAEFSAQTNGRYGGVGMEITFQNNNSTVARVFPNTPAENAGIQEGDRIVKIDTADTHGWKTDKVSDRLKGVPGTKVDVTFQRPGVTAPIPVRFTRAQIHIPAVPYSIVMNDNVGYIPVQRFNETTSSEIAAALQKMEKSGAKSIVLDLRGNPGGILEEAIATSNLFLNQGQSVLSVRGRQEAQQYSATAKPLAPTIPLVVLTDGYAASASEIVAGALQDHDRALIVGTTSYGKGLVQTVYNLDGGYAVKLTTAKWFTPSGRSIQKERKLTDDGQFVEVRPDSLETDSVRRARPAFKSDVGRTVYGGGGITPDLIVPADTITTPEQQLAKSLAPKFPEVYTVLSDLALEQKGKVAQNFTVQPAWRDEFLRRLETAGVKVDRTLWNNATPWVDRQLEQRVARVAFGDSTAKRHELKDDVQLQKALEVLRKGQTQRQLFAVAQSMTPPAAAHKAAVVTTTPKNP